MAAHQSPTQPESRSKNAPQDGSDKDSSPVDGRYDADEVAFLKAHRKASFWSSVFFALAGATFIGVLNNVFGRMLNQNAATGQAPHISTLFKDRQTLGRMTGMMGFGAGCMYISNWLESRKTLLEWRMGGNKVGRKLAVAEAQQEPQAAPASLTAAPSAFDAPKGRADGKSWREVAVQPQQAVLSR